MNGHQQDGRDPYSGSSVNRSLTPASDLVFRHAGWARTSILGQQVKSFDLELTEPLTRDR